MSNNPPRGFTLIELIVFIVIVSVGLAGVLTVFNTVTRGSADPIRQKQALAAAESLLEEIVNRNFCDPDTATLPAAGASAPALCGAHTKEASRDLYDDVDDYCAYSSTGIVDVTAPAGPPVLAGYNASVQVCGTPVSSCPGNPCAALGDLVAGGATVTGTNYRVVTVTVTDAMTNQNYAVTGYKFNND